MPLKLGVFRFWCQKVLPLVYDDSLSYYEVLCKVVDYINNIIADQKEMTDEIHQLQEELKVVQDWINNFDTSFFEETVDKYIADRIKTVIFGLSTAGYFMAYIPSKWSDLQFGTIQTGPLYGHLTLGYD